MYFQVPSSAKLIYGEDKSTGKMTKFPLVTVRNTYLFPGVPSILENALPLLKVCFPCHANNILLLERLQALFLITTSQVLVATGKYVHVTFQIIKKLGHFHVKQDFSSLCGYLCKIHKCIYMQ